MNSETTIRSAIGSDAGRVSALLMGFVGKPFQRSGLARRLWDVARVNARNPAGPFSVNASHYAVPAYRRMGFRLSGPAQERNGVQFQPMEWAVDAADAL